jgi:hypothetical protein
MSLMAEVDKLEQISDFEATIRSRALRFGITPAELRARDRELFSTPDFSQECLEPYEVEQLFAGDLPQHRVEHLNHCTLCTAMVQVAHPKEQWFNEFIRSDAAQSAMNAASYGAAKKQNSWTPVLQASVLIVAALSLVAVTCVAAIRSNDVLLSSLIKEAAPKSTFVFFSAAIAALFLAGGASRLSTSKFNFLHGAAGFVVGGLFACFACGFIAYSGLEIARDYGHLQSAQYSLLGRIAFSQSRNELFEDSLYSEKLRDMPGTLVAVRDAHKFDISWEKPAGFLRGRGQRLLGSVYEGSLQTETGGAQVIWAGKKEIDVAQGLISAGIRYRKDINVLALVPPNGDEASAVITLGKSGEVKAPEPANPAK